MVDDKPISPPIGQVERPIVNEKDSSGVQSGFVSEPLETATESETRVPEAPKESPISPPIAPLEHAAPAHEPAIVPPVVHEPVRQPQYPPPVTPTMPRKKKSNALLKWMILLAVGLFVVSIGSLFWSNPSFSDRDVVLTIEGPERAISGEEVTYIIRWENNTKLELKDLSFRLFYPEDSVVIVDGTPTQPDSDGFTVDSLAPSSSGEREVTLFMVGDKGSIKTATVNLIFKAGTLRSAFEKEVQTKTTVTDLPVSLTVTAPPTTVSGQSMTYIIDARNETEEDFTDLRLEVTFPDGFTVRDISPQPDAGSTTWSIARLAPDAGKRFTIQGALSGVQREAKTITASLKREVGGQYIDFVKTDSVTLLSSPLLSASLTVNGARDYVAHPGDTLRYRIAYENNSSHNLIGLELEVKLDGQMFDYEGLRVDNGFFDSGINTVRFSASGVPDFASLPPGRSGTVEFSVPLRSSFLGGGGTQSFFVKSSARLRTPNVPTGVEGNEVFAQDVVTTKIVSQPTLGQVVRVAGGATPLQVGEKTLMEVTWTITNPGNELDDASVNTTLPPGIAFERVISGDGLSFDPNTRRVDWTVGDVPFGTGAGMPAFTASFEVSLTPSSNQQGQVPQILGNAALSGTDSFTKQSVQSVIREVKSSDVQGLESDPRVQ